jgi:hypothetical protein
MRSIYWLLIICFSAISCRKDWQVALDHADEVAIHSNTSDDWVLVETIKQKDHKIFLVKKIDSDTLKYLYVVHSKEGNTFNRYIREFPCDRAKCVLEMFRQDTLYYYSEMAGIRTFSAGEYQYRYEKLMLDSIELDYFQMHADSLRKVRGNLLPRLH